MKSAGIAMRLFLLSLIATFPFSRSRRVLGYLVEVVKIPVKELCETSPAAVSGRDGISFQPSPVRIEVKVLVGFHTGINVCRIDRQNRSFSLFLLCHATSDLRYGYYDKRK